MASDGVGQLLSDNPIAVVIVGCEIAFWLVLAAGLALRYPAKRPRAGSIVLLCVPIVDVVLLVVTAIDLHRGATATAVHGLAAVYLGVSVAFGHRMIGWADAHFAHRFAGGPKPAKPPKHGPAKLAREWKDFGLLLIAAAISVGCLFLLRWIAVTPEQTDMLMGRLGTVGIVLAVWFIVGPVSAMFTLGKGDRVGSDSEPDEVRQGQR